MGVGPLAAGVALDAESVTRLLAYDPLYGGSIVGAITAAWENGRGAREQATGLHQINTAVNSMDQMTQQSAAMVEETTAASHSLAKETQDLVGLVDHFQVGGTGAGRPAQASAPRRGAPAARPAVAQSGRGGAAALRKPEPEAGWEEF